MKFIGLPTNIRKAVADCNAVRCVDYNRSHDRSESLTEIYIIIADVIS